MLPTLARTLEAHDPYARAHAARVTALAEVLVERLPGTAPRLETVRLGAPLHDIGKIWVPKSILCKPGPLNEAELARVREHPAVGAGIVRAVPAVSAALPYVLYHHERWDGRGYPTGRAGRAIPLGARVLAVADAFDAMTSERPYRHALGAEYALEEIERCSGSQFDPAVVRAFVSAWDDGAVAVRRPRAKTPGRRAS